MSASEQLRQAYSRVSDIDIGVLKSAIQGDEEARTEIYGFYQRNIHGYFFRSEIPFDEIADCGQNVWEKVFDKLNGYEIHPNVPFRSWLYKIAHNVAADYYRSRRQLSEVVGEQIEVTCTHPFSNPEWVSEVTEQYEAISRQIELLGPEKAQAFYNHYILGLDHSTSARILDTSADNARQLSSRGRKKIISALLKEGNLDSC